MSQNGPHLLVSNKRDLAASIASNLIAIDWLFASVVGDFRLSVRRKKAAADADNAATEFVKLERNMASMRGEMSQMIAERPNAGAVRHQNRCGAVRRPRSQGFVPVTAHGIIPIGVAAGPRKCPALSTLACSFGWFCWLVRPCHPQREVASRRVPWCACDLSSAEYESLCMLRAISSLIAVRPSGAFRARRCHALARCCASLAFASNRCASLKTPSSARH